ncbi:MAG: hypothetical protein II333_02960, partial [Clostridia bacterium]|nr:hypothetical protein [Clostridia bacterium]
AASLTMSLQNGGVASVAMNYLNPSGFPGWGNESVRVFGTRGMVELTDGGKRTHLYTDHDEGEADTGNSDCRDYFDLLMRHFRYGEALPLSVRKNFILCVWSSAQKTRRKRLYKTKKRLPHPEKPDTAAVRYFIRLPSQNHRQCRRIILRR